VFLPGLPDFSWYNIPKRGKYTDKTTKYIKWPLKYKMVVKFVPRPNSHKIYQHLSQQDTPKFTQIGIFGLKLYNLATLVSTECRLKVLGCHRFRKRTYLTHLFVK
jgi:hypothetical protein